MKTPSLLVLCCVCLASFTACTNSTDFNTPRAIIQNRQIAPPSIASDTSGTMQSDTATPLNILRRPVITGFSPSVISRFLHLGTVFIFGSNFSNVTQVLLGGVPAKSFTITSDKELKVFADPENTVSGSITVINQFGSTRVPNFYFNSPPAEGGGIIRNFFPNSVTPGSTVFITGVYLNLATLVTFGGFPATSFTVISDTQIKAIVSHEARSGAVGLTSGNVFSTVEGFTVLQGQRNISSFEPSSGRINTRVSIFGLGFQGASSVRFGGVNAASFIVVSDTRIDAVVGAGATGEITISTPGGATSLAGFTFLP